MEIADHTEAAASRRYAAIDIGSNAVRLLIKSGWGAPPIRTDKLLFVRVPLRLGADVFTVGKLSDDRARNLRRLMKAFSLLMRIYDVDEYRAYATSAMRDAKNGKSLIEEIEKKSGIKISIITGAEEARIIYGNHLERQDEATQDYLYVDVGGGSTEITMIRQGSLILSRSYNIGTVRMLCGAVDQAEVARLRTDMEALHTSLPLHIVGSGGNINKLWRLLGKKQKSSDSREPKSMTPAELQSLLAQLEPYTPAQRQEIFSLKPDRADVIVPAGKIFLLIAKLTGAVDIQVPVVGLADGLIDEMARASV